MMSSVAGTEKSWGLGEESRGGFSHFLCITTTFVFPQGGRGQNLFCASLFPRLPHHGGSSLGASDGGARKRDRRRSAAAAVVAEADVRPSERDEMR